MNTKTQTFCRTLTAAERKELKKVGEIDGIDTTAPLLSWCQKKAKDRDLNNAIYFFEVWANCLVSAPMLDYVATVDGIVIAMQTAGGVERLYHFEESEYAEAIDFYNKMQVALEKKQQFLTKEAIMTTYNVMQHRGNGKECKILSGSFERCADFLCKVANVPEEVVYPYCNTHYTATDPEEVNGDGQPYDYYIKRG